MTQRRSDPTQREYFDFLSGLMNATDKDTDDKMRITENEIYGASRRAAIGSTLM